MVIDLLGVLEDGSPRAAWVPANPRAALRLPRAGDVTVRVTVVRADGSPVDLTGKTVALTLVRTTRQEGVVPPGLQVTASGPATGGPPNVAALALSSAQTKALEARRYVYDVWLNASGVRDVLVPLSECVVEPAAALA